MRSNFSTSYIDLQVCILNPKQATYHIHEYKSKNRKDPLHKGFYFLNSNYLKKKREKYL